MVYTDKLHKPYTKQPFFKLTSKSKSIFILGAFHEQSLNDFPSYIIETIGSSSKIHMEISGGLRKDLISAFAVKDTSNWYKYLTPGQKKQISTIISDYQEALRDENISKELNNILDNMRHATSNPFAESFKIDSIEKLMYFKRPIANMLLLQFMFATRFKTFIAIETEVPFAFGEEKISSLDSIDSYLLPFTSDKFLDLLDYNLNRKLHTALYSFLQENDFKMLNTDCIESFSAYCKSNQPDLSINPTLIKSFISTFCTQRNKLWIPKIMEQASKAKGNTCVIVGLSHLFFENGLLQLLMDQGYACEILEVGPKSERGKWIPFEKKISCSLSDRCEYTEKMHRLRFAK